MKKQTKKTLVTWLIIIGWLAFAATLSALLVNR